jgi:hypothetical protein
MVRCGANAGRWVLRVGSGPGDSQEWGHMIRVRDLLNDKSLSELFPNLPAWNSCFANASSCIVHHVSLTLGNTMT